jgi:DNA-binding transcriptional regulator YiaG
MTDIKSLRTASGMTQKEFAEYFDIPKRTIENWESNTRKCPTYLIHLIEFKLKTENKI